LIDLRILVRAAVVGIVLEIALVGSGHFVPFIARNLFLFGGMIIVATAAYLYGMDSGRGYFPGATGGAIVAGISGFLGSGLAVLLGDGPQSIIPFYTAICVFTGAIGGLFGQMAFNMRKRGL